MGAPTSKRTAHSFRTSHTSKPSQSNPRQTFRAPKATNKCRNSDQDALIYEYSHLKGWKSEEDALHTIRRLGSCVKPMMRKRGWTVGVLAEFYPQDGNLLGLNVNHGKSIFVRLRQTHHKDRFMPFDQCLDTLLHELAHIAHSAHDERFQATWDELRDEWTELQIKGYTGQAFLGKGKYLSGRRIPRDELERLARDTARREHDRAKADAAKRGRTLGSSLPRPAPGSQNLRDAASQAAIRRNGLSNNGCGTGTKAASAAVEDALLNGFRSKEDMDEANELAIQQATFELMEKDETNRLWRQSQLPTDNRSSSVSSSSIYSSSEASSHLSAASLAWDADNGYHVEDMAWPSPPSRSAIEFQSALSGIPLGEQWGPPLNSSGRPVSRVILEAEAQQRSSRQKRITPQFVEWDCRTCTFLNPHFATRCEVCDTPSNAAPTASRSFAQISG